MKIRRETEIAFISAPNRSIGGVKLTSLYCSPCVNAPLATLYSRNFTLKNYFDSIGEVSSVDECKERNVCFF